MCEARRWCWRLDTEHRWTYGLSASFYLSCCLESKCTCLYAKVYSTLSNHEGRLCFSRTPFVQSSKRKTIRSEDLKGQQEFEVMQSMYECIGRYSGDVQFPNTSPEDRAVSDSAKFMISFLLTPDANSRPLAKECLTLPWYLNLE